MLPARSGRKVKILCEPPGPYGRGLPRIRRFILREGQRAIRLGSPRVPSVCSMTEPLSHMPMRGRALLGGFRMHGVWYTACHVGHVSPVYLSLGDRGPPRATKAGGAGKETASVRF